MQNVYKILVGDSEGQKPLRRPGYRWKDNISMGPRGISWEVVSWIRLAQYREQ
jgi:hypothetical protein